MNLLWIDNVSDWLNDIADQLEETGWNVKILDENQLQQKPDDIGVTIFKEYAAVDLFLININILLPGQRRIDNAGAKLLKLIRLHNLRQHCVVYSFLSKEQLMQLNPENLILFSAGITFNRLPDDLLKLPLKILSKNTSPENLARYMVAELNLPDERHMLANWFGVLQLWKMHCAVKNREFVNEVDFADQHLKKLHDEMNSYQGLLARYLFRDRQPDVEQQIKLMIQRQEDLIGERNVEIDKINFLYNQHIEQYERTQDQIKILENAFLDEYGSHAALSVLQDLGLLTQPIEDILRELNFKQSVSGGMIERIEQYNEFEYLIRREINQLEQEQIRQAEEIQDLTSQLEQKERFISYNFSLTRNTEQLNKIKPGILYVDDQAEEGWAYVLQQIIYDAESEHFFTISPDKDDSIEKISSEIVRIYKEQNISLIILDLRLKGEIGHSSQTETISGFEVLKSLYNQHISCPILVFSASNKLWSLEESVRLGASAYWMKEGIEDKKDIAKSVSSYLHLIDLISVLCLSPQYCFLVELKEKYSALHDYWGIFWWEGLSWVNPEAKYKKSKIASERKIVNRVLLEAIYMLENFLHERLIRNITIGNAGQTPSLIIISLSRILELIHRTDNDLDENRIYISLSNRIFDQIPEIENNRHFDLVKMRNAAAHQLNKSFDELKHFIDQLCEYLYDYKSFEIETSIKSEPPNQVETLVEPTPGGKYQTRIIRKFKTDHIFYYLTNPGLILEREFIILDMRWNPQLTDIEIEEGDQVEFNIKIDRKENSVNYYAENTVKLTLI